jgi:hypothetical protein
MASVTPVVYHMSYIAVIVAAIASLVWGWIWHTWICGKRWASECGMHASMDKRQVRMATILSFIGALLTACVLHRLLFVAQVANLMPDKTAYKYGFCMALLVWVGFYIPMVLHATVWMKKKWSFFFIKIVNQFFNLLIITMLLAHWAVLNKV